MIKFQKLMEFLKEAITAEVKKLTYKSKNTYQKNEPKFVEAKIDEEEKVDEKTLKQEKMLSIACKLSERELQREFQLWLTLI